jgi:alginate O-acetyltransferase complex protein AlgI
MPIGISFYTFQFIAYLVDVYKGKTEPAGDFLSFWVFMSFFPHRVAGPIMRGKDLIPQIERITKITFNSSQFKLGLAFLAMGLIKKIFLADYIAIYANRFFDQGTALTGSQAWIGALLFTFQIYYDFSAYSEMAVGIAYLFGIKLDLNFKTPYLSGNPSEFWRRWHITLSTWIRDYIYIPLGGSRRGEYRKYLHLFIAMAISGLWHGAAWTFVVWGIYHGLLLILHNLYTKFLNHYSWEKITSNWFYKVLTILVMFNLANIGWVFFRADNLGLAYHMVAGMLTTNPLFFDVSLYQYVLVILALYSLHVVEYWLRKNYTPIYTMWERRVPAPLRALVYTALIAALVIFAPTQQNSFIYFRF